MVLWLWLLFIRSMNEYICGVLFISDEWVFIVVYCFYDEYKNMVYLGKLFVVVGKFFEIIVIFYKIRWRFLEFEKWFI